MLSSFQFRLRPSVSVQNQPLCLPGTAFDGGTSPWRGNATAPTGWHLPTIQQESRRPELCKSQETLKQETFPFGIGIEFVRIPGTLFATHRVCCARTSDKPSAMVWREQIASSAKETCGRQSALCGSGNFGSIGFRSESAAGLEKSSRHSERTLPLGSVVPL